MQRKRLELVGLLVPLTMAAAVRFFNLGHGLPELVHVDAFKFVGEALRLAEGTDLAPRVVQHPGLLTHSLAVLYRLFQCHDPATAHLVARAIAAASGTALVGATWLLARSLAGARAAALAASLAALCPVAVTASRTPAPDILVTLFITLSVWAMTAMKPGLTRASSLGMLSGLAVGSKFTGLLLLPWSLLTAIWVVPRQIGRLRLALVWAGTAGAIFTLTTPLFWAHAPRYVERLLSEAQLQRYGQIGRIQGSWLDYLGSTTPTWEQPWLGTSLSATHGWIFLIAIAIAMLTSIVDRQRSFILLSAAVIAYLALVSGPGRIKAIRFLLPILPLLQVLVAWVVDRLMTGLASVKLRVSGIVTAGALLIAPSMIHTTDLLLLTTSDTTNHLAANWMKSHIEPGTKTLLSPFFVANLATTGISPASLANVGARQYRRPEHLGPSPERDPIYTAELIDQAISGGIELIVLNSYFDNAFLPIDENLRFFPRSVSEWQAFRARLEQRGRLVNRFDGYNDGRLGPDIEIWALSHTSGETTLESQPEAVIEGQYLVP